MICEIEEAGPEGLVRYPDELPLPARFDEVPAGFYLSAHQVELMLAPNDPDFFDAEGWRLSEHQETRIRDMRLRHAAAEVERRRAEITRRREEKKARRLALWRRDFELQELKRARPDWFRPGLNAHNLELRRQKMEIVKRVAGYLAELCGPGGYADMETHYGAAKLAIYGTETPYQSPRKIKDLWVQVSTLARDFIAARTAAKEAADKAAAISASEGVTPPPSRVRLPNGHKGKSIQRTLATRLSETAGYSTRRAPLKPEVSISADKAWAAPETIPHPDVPGASKGPRNIAWLPAKHLPHKITGLAVANLDKLEFGHGRYGCTVAWDRRHALNFLASGLAAGRPLSGLVSAYKNALKREDFGTWMPGQEKRTPGRLIARARRAAYRLDLVTRWALESYREKRGKTRHDRERCRAFEASAKAAHEAENARVIEAARAAVNSPDFDDRARARRFLDGLGIAY